jgi:hypothetical protein
MENRDAMTDSTTNHRKETYFCQGSDRKGNKTILVFLVGEGGVIYGGGVGGGEYVVFFLRATCISVA